MRRAGIVEAMTITVVVFAMVAVLGNISILSVEGAGDLIRAEATGITAERISSTALGLAAFENARVEMELDRRKYRLFENDRDEIVIQYSFILGKNNFKIREPDGVEINLQGNPDKGFDAEKEDDLAKKFCLESREDQAVYLMPGGCQ